MKATDGSSPASDEEETPVTVHKSSPDRVVFVEQDNSDGWIATDLAVDVRE
jgi:hypothetical protein